MKKITLLLGVLIFLITGKLSAQQLLHYWNFNDISSEAAVLTVSYSVVSGAAITNIAGPNSSVNLSATGQNFDIQNLNARNGDDALSHLRFNAPIGAALEFNLPTTGFQEAKIKFATRRSSTGAAADQYWYYSVDGTNFIPYDTIYPNAGDPTLESLDFDTIAAADNNPNFKLRVEFGNGGPTTGNHRFDNFTLDASPMPVLALVHYWNFNDASSEANVLAVSYSVVSGAAITNVAGPNSSVNLSATGQNFDIQNLNARNGDAALSHLRFNSPIGAALEYALPTTGYEKAKIKFATRRSSTGAAADQYWYYSVDGTNFIPYDTIFPFAGDPTLESLDFDTIAAVDNNPNFKLRVEFGNGGPTTGNHRFDNFTLDAYPIGGGDNIAPVATLLPSNGSVNVAIGINPTVSFNEAVRLLDNSILDNTNAATVVELRLNDEFGAIVPFTTTVSSNEITIIPDNPLNNNQQYYVALLANTIEDMSDNAITANQAIQFTTISVQTQFNVGDMVFVAYRMNATATEDEVALLTLVDIIPGTFINLTDAKYTTNAQPQCANGIVWTAPSTGCITAGTTIYIQTSALVANIGTVTGSGFGLSSSGDQVIVYTGTALNPNYITALTSIDWLVTNTSCSGSLSMIPAGLVDGISSLNTSSAPGNVSGNAVNAFYNGIQTGTPAQLRTEILNPTNWIAEAGGTAPQTWPAYNFPAPPTVSQATVVNSTTIQLIFNADLNTTSAEDVNNYTGIAGLISAVVTNNGTAIDTVTLTYSSSFNNSVSYTLTVNNIMDVNNLVMGCEYQFTFTYDTKIKFNQNFIVVEEDHGTLNLALTLENPSACSVDLVVLPAPYSTADASDFTLTTQKLTFTGASNTAQLVTIPIIDDVDDEQKAEYFVLVLRNETDCSINGDTLATIYIRDNDRVAPIPTNDIELNYVGSFDPSGSNSSTCEVVAYDPISKRLFATSAISGFLDIIDFSNPSTPVTINSVDMNSYGGITSVAVKNSVVAIASPNTNEQLNGSVVFLDTNGVFVNQVNVGALPDMITFTPDGTKVLTADEGQPNDAYSVDPEGSVSVIDITPGVANITQANVTVVDFTSFNSQEAALIASGVRKTKSTSTLSQDFEPEYITIDSTSSKAWVSLQENNAMAEINLQTLTVTEVWALGTKDYSFMGNGADVSNNNNEILIANWPVKGFYQPDAITTYQVAGVNYIITANEGDEKEYAGLNERTTVGAATYVLDPTAFPNADVLKKSYNLGRYRVSNLNGDIDNDGDYDEIYALGSRSFSIFNADTKTLVYDSGDDFEQYISSNPTYSPIFNANHEDNTRKGRSHTKGPEPEGVTVAKINNKTFAFVSLERVGGVMVYDVTNPNDVKFVDYKNSRSVSAYTGDHGPETMVFIPSTTSPDGKNYVIVANEISGTLTIFEVVNNLPTSVETPQTKSLRFNIFPNPSNQNIVFFNRKATVDVIDISGRIVFSGKEQLTLDVSNYKNGVYFVKTNDGEISRLVVNK
jgi:hypothetical protein